MLSQTQQIRFNRQIMLKRIGESGQAALQRAKVLIIGLGGLGNPVSLYLNAAGVGNLFLIDGDKIDASNLARQVIFNEQDIGANKADITADKLQQQNSDSQIEVLDEMLDQELADHYFPEMDLIIDCTDNINTRFMVNQKCVEHKVPLITGAATGFDGQYLFIDPSNEQSACYQCLFPSNKQVNEQNCQTLGIIGPVLAIIAGMQSLQAIKYLTNNEVSINQLHMFDGLSNQWQQFAMKKQAHCAVCGNKDSQ